MKKTSLLTLLLVITFCTQKVFATNDTICVTMQPSAANGQDIDAALVQGAPTTNYGTHPNFYSDTWTCSSNLCLASSLIRFDLSSIPTGAIIVSANLSLYADANNTSDGISGSPTYGTNNAGWIQRVTSSWAVNTVTWNTQPAVTTTDEVDIPQSTGTAENYTLNVAPIINDILTSGNNYGMEIVQQNQTTYYNSLIFASSNNADATKHPMLQICYTVPDTNETCITMQPSAANGQDIDAALVQGASTTNYGTHPNFYSDTWTCSSNLCLASSLIRFDLSSIPADATIVSADLSLYADANNTSDGISGSPTYGTNNAGWIQRVTSSWAVNTVTWNTQPTVTTTDEVDIPQSTGTAENYTLNVAPIINDILTSGNNYGMEIVQQNQTTYYNSLIFASSNNADATKHPMLQICYTTPTGIQAINKNSSLITVYPNPATNNVVFNTSKLGDEMKGYYVELYNILGQNVQTTNLHPYSTIINTANFPRGVYMYRVMQENKFITSGKLILQ